MRIVATGVALLLIMGSALLSQSPASEANEVQVTATAGAAEDVRKDFKYKIFKLTTPVAPQVATPKPAREEPRAPVLEVQQTQQTQTIVAPPPAAEEPAAPQQDPAVAACRGKLVGAECSFESSGSVKSGTCITPAWSPLTCVLH